MSRRTELERLQRLTAENEQLRAALAAREQANEVIGFAEWLGRHCRIGGHEVPPVGTTRRRLLAWMFEGLEEEGLDVATAARGLELGSPEKTLAAMWGWVARQDDEDRRAGVEP